MHHGDAAEPPYCAIHLCAMPYVSSDGGPGEALRERCYPSWFHVEFNSQNLRRFEEDLLASSEELRDKVRSGVPSPVKMSDGAGLVRQLGAELASMGLETPKSMPSMPPRIKSEYEAAELRNS